MMRRAGAVLLVCSLAACGGGSGGSGGVTPKAPPGGNSTSSKITFAFAAATAVKSIAVQVFPANGSSGTSAQMSVAPGGSGCTPLDAHGNFSCTLSVAAVPGSDVLQIGEFAAGASPLRSSLVTAQTALRVVENGMVASANAIIWPGTLAVAAPAAATLSVVAYDAAGDVILGSAPYASAGGAVTFTTNASVVPTAGGAGDFTPHGAQFTAPGQTQNIGYNGGGASSGSITLSASANGIFTHNASVTFTTASAGITVPGVPQATIGQGTTTYPVDQMALGPDGRLWGTEQSGSGWGGPYIARIGIGKNPKLITEFTTANGLVGIAQYITTGPDNNIWYYDPQGDGSLGQVRRFAVPSGSTIGTTTSTAAVVGRVGSLVSAPDGFVYVGDSGSGYLEAIWPFDMTVTRYNPAIPGDTYPFAQGPATVGPKLGAAQHNSVCLAVEYIAGFSATQLNGVECFDLVTHTFTPPYAIGTSFEGAMVTGPDGLLYVYDTSGTITAFSTASGKLVKKGQYGVYGVADMTVGSDGNIWLALWNHPNGFGSISIEATGSLGRLNAWPSYQTGLPIGANPNCIVRGSDGYLYLCDADATFIERINP